MLRLARSCRRALAMGIVFCALLMTTGRTTLAGQLDATWTAPTTNTDGSALTDLSKYNVYVGISPAVPCPGTPAFNQISTTTTPAPNTTVGPVNIPGLITSTIYNVQVTAVDTSGNESPCSLMATATARPDTVAQASFTVNGLTINQVVTGNLQVNAVPVLPAGVTLDHFAFNLFNPTTGAVISANNEFAAPYCFVGDNGSLPCLPFDTTTIPNGTYNLEIDMIVVPTNTVTWFIPFTVNNGAPPTPVPSAPTGVIFK